MQSVRQKQRSSGSLSHTLISRCLLRCFGFACGIYNFGLPLLASMEHTLLTISTTLFTIYYRWPFGQRYVDRWQNLVRTLEKIWKGTFNYQLLMARMTAPSSIMFVRWPTKCALTIKYSPWHNHSSGNLRMFETFSQSHPHVAIIEQSGEPNKLHAHQ